MATPYCISRTACNRRSPATSSFDPDTSPAIVDEIVGEAVTRFHREAAAIPGAYLRVFVGTDQQLAIDALTRHGASAGGTVHPDP